MKKGNKIVSLLVAFAMVFTFLPASVANAETAARTVQKEVKLYEWDLTKPGTFWSVTGGTSNPVTENSGSDSNAEYKIDENGAYLLGKSGYPSYNTTGSASNVDMSDSTTKLVVEFETASKATVFIKASFNSAHPDNKATLLEKTITGYYRYEKTISSSDTKFASLQLGVFAGGAVTFKSAKIVKTVAGPRKDDDGATQKLIKSYSMTDNTDISETHAAANPTYGENGLTMNATAAWAGFTTKTYVVDISDVSTKLVVNLDNPNSATIAFKYKANNCFYGDKGDVLAGEMLLTSANGKIEIYLDKFFTKEQLSALSKTGIMFQALVGTTNKALTINSMELVKTTVPIFNKKINMGNPTNFWVFQGMPTSAEYLAQGITRPLSGVSSTGSYELNPAEGTMSINAIESNGVFWYGANLNSYKVDLNRNPKLKFNVVSAGNRWTLKLGINDNYVVNVFNEYGNSITSGEVVINLADYADKLTPYETATSGVLSMGMVFMTLTNGDNKPTVIKDMRIEYQNADAIEAVNQIPETVINTDTKAQDKLPAYLSVSSESYKDDIHVTWTPDLEYDAQKAGTYTFTGVLNEEDLYNCGLTNELPVTATINVKEFLFGNVNNDDTVDLKDLVRLKKNLAGIESAEVYFVAADLNSDNTIGNEDLIALRKLLLEK